MADTQLQNLVVDFLGSLNTGNINQACQELQNITKQQVEVDLEILVPKRAQTEAILRQEQGNVQVQNQNIGGPALIEFNLQASEREKQIQMLKEIEEQNKKNLPQFQNPVLQQNPPYNPQIQGNYQQNNQINYPEPWKNEFGMTQKEIEEQIRIEKEIEEQKKKNLPPNQNPVLQQNPPYNPQIQGTYQQNNQINYPEP